MCDTLTQLQTIFSILRFAFCLICSLSHLPNQISVPLSFVHFLLDLHSSSSVPPAFLKICSGAKYRKSHSCAHSECWWMSLSKVNPPSWARVHYLRWGQGGHPLTLQLLGESASLKVRKAEVRTLPHSMSSSLPWWPVQIAARLL